MQGGDCDNPRSVINILVNNAATNRPKPLEDVTIEDFDAIMGLNVRAAYFVAQGAVARGCWRLKQFGLDHQYSSQRVTSARRGAPFTVPAARDGGFTKAMAIELAPQRNPA